MTGCTACGGGGWMLTLLRADPSLEFAFICTKCEAANNRNINTNHGARYWRDEFRSDYLPRMLTMSSTLECEQFVAAHREASK
jgi:hypothetical protein